MKKENKKLYLGHIDKKIKSFRAVSRLSEFPRGWVYSIRTALGMSLQQLGDRLKITPQSVKEIEDREKNKTISLKTLEDVARALDMKLIYGFYPRATSLEKMIEQRAESLAKQIVLKTSKTMQLEDQGNSKARIKKAVAERKKELIDTIPRHLWDM